MDEGWIIIGVFLDLKKAFDCVDMRGSMHGWYLENCKQFVVINDSKSCNSKITCGVPQGGILGPLLFNLDVNDLHKAVNEAQCILFADDTNIFIEHEEPIQIANIMNNVIPSLSNWLTTNKLKLNKMHYIVIELK